MTARILPIAGFLATFTGLHFFLYYGNFRTATVQGLVAALCGLWIIYPSWGSAPRVARVIAILHTVGACLAAVWLSQTT